MKLFKRNKKQTTDEKISLLVADINGVFNKIAEDFDAIAEKQDTTSQDFYELRDELATNGVVRDLRKLEKSVDEARKEIAELAAYTINRLNDLDTNGVATAINKLNKEVFGKKKDEGSIFARVLTQMTGAEPSEEVTLAGKVDAIIEHLGIEVSVKPKEVTPAKIVTKKVKTQKKGRK